MTNTFRVGLVGARGYVGREMMQLIEADPAFTLALASSREHAGKPIQQMNPSLKTPLTFVASDPEAVAKAGCDALILGLPNGMAAPYVEAVDKVAPKTVVVDLSADYRHVSGWTFGLSDLERDLIRGQKRIANPGCYATAGILALYPIRDLLAGTPSVFGLSGYSGAGTKRGPKNDPARLKDNILPYGFAGHGHQGEISAAIGQPVRFMPHVLSLLRGLLAPVSAPLVIGTSEAMVWARYKEAYADNSTIDLTVEPPEPKAVANTPKAALGGVAIDPTTNVLSVACAHDNLLKGAASQALANLRLAVGLD